MKSSDLKSSQKPKKIQLWTKSIIHFALCFTAGFFTGFAPSTTSSAPQIHAQNPSRFSEGQAPSPKANRTLLAEIQSIQTKKVESLRDSKQLIIVTTTRAGDSLQGALLERMAQTVRAVPAPVVWVVVERRSEAVSTARMLRRSGVMYRHLTYSESFSDFGAESEHQRNVALGHVEFHRIDGIVCFAEASNVYELEFFEEIRRIDVFGVWPVAMLTANRRKVIVDGPVCRSSKVVGWFLKDMSHNFTGSVALKNSEMTIKPKKINISGFAFNSSILWDPERWGRPTSLPDTSQDSFKFIENVILKDETKLKCIPSNFNKIMLWNLNIPMATPFPSQKTVNQG